ncbi:MarR family winged helix-turn-helix transcriptional regulator [Nocardia testacea]|uniref:MarR family winged helix-turn-helix transcriptional regulator n=1 Tax=Nocardia testacea TaxID=248551 RepID=UPI0003156760|nr:MarR family winged helix-turn-helix transcriptional regulator [Nocardia testacea]
MPASTEITQNLLGELFLISRALRGTLLHSDAGQLLPGGLGVLTTLETAGPCRQVGLAADLRITPSAMSRHITELAAAGYISREADPSDGRASLVRLTPEGQGLLHRVRAFHTRHLQETLGDWTENDVEQAYQVVRRLRNSLNSRDRCGTADENPQVSKERADV